MSKPDEAIHTLPCGLEIIAPAVDQPPWAGDEEICGMPVLGSNELIGEIS